MFSQIELLGYAASLLVFISLAMTSVVRFRVINAVGSLLFVVFALKTHSIPTAFLNLGIVGIDLYYLFRISHIKTSFEILSVSKENELLQHFYNKHKDEINHLFGEDWLAKSDFCAFFMQNSEIAGLLGFSCKDMQGMHKTAIIQADFVFPKYRDVSVGQYFFVQDTRFWKDRDIAALEAHLPQKSHIGYLEKIGFVQQNDPTIWKKIL